ncbi:hypothetical protein QTP70_005979 [Hemibagrus guttatus]|uniref:Reverse transcriptase domain-containing protein n=1 Tax=Hemibagrus guttatus TaxID=175788 RepID=A0AAE0R6P3_9TELE|nr:hypothetical protein QTP70_005979 [Hemibagrus guttatus]
MQRGGDKKPAPVVRLRHSVRVQLQSDAPEDVRRRFGWGWVVLRVLRDLCKIQASKIFCLQDFTSAGFLDVTFSAFSDCSSFFDQCSRLPEEESLWGLRLVPLFAMDEVPVTVHLYNPFVADEDIRAFLGRYCSAVAAGERIRGRFGIWNGKRRFLARLKVDPSSPGGLLHPPGSFTIGPHRGYLHYPGHPLYCRRCGALGHTKERCMGRRCRSCGAEGHSAADCGAPKTCSLCGSEEHLYRYCPARKKTFASLFTEDPEEVGAHSGGQQVGAGPAQRGAEPQGAVRVAELAAEPPGQPDQEQRAAEDTRDPPQEAEASEVEGGLLDEARPSEAATSDLLSSGLELELEPSIQPSAWTPMSWADALEGLEEMPGPARPDWSSMEFSDIVEQGGSPQESEEGGARPAEGQTRPAEGVPEERNPKRTRREGRREFDLLTLEEGKEAAVSVVPGRLLCVDGTFRGSRFRAIAVYAPCRVGQRRGFFRQLEPLLSTNRFLLVGGDFNVDVEAEGGGELAQVVAGAGLVDVYRSVEPQASGHTWRNSRGDTARLDFLFVAERARVQSCSLRPFWGSDHCMVVGCIELEVGQRGRGFWRLNTTVLQDPSFCKVFRHLYAGWRRLRGLYTTQIEWWEDLKRRVAILCHWWGQEMARRRREGAETWSRELCEAWKAGDYGRLRDASEALRAHYEAEARSHFVQAGREALEQDERPTRYFFSSVRSRQRRSYIEGLRSGPDVVTSPGDMLEVARSFYSDLFGVRQTEDDCAAVFLDAVAGRMPEESVPDLEREISLEEVERAMLSLKTGVAPGGDGLPAEWYRTFWPVVGPDLLAVYREAVREVMARVVHPDQTCGVPGRMCGMNLALVRDALAWADQRRVPLALLSLDQEKAFDRVSHAFLFALLRRMGFGPGFVAMVRLLYAGAVSRVIVNGHCSGLIEQRGGGLHIPGAGGTRAKVSVYADDATLFLGRDEDFRAVSGILEAFSDATGARINRKDSAQKNWDIALSKLKARAESWCKRDLSLTGRVVAACSDLLAGLNHLALVFPIPFVTGRRLERALFTFIWGGRSEQTMAMHVAFLTKLVRGTEGHMASLFARFWIGFALRAVIPWKGTSPWSTDRPWHYQKVAEFIRGHPWCLVDGLVLDHRKLERLYRHGISPTPLCPIGCGGEETVEHALWSGLKRMGPETANPLWQTVSVAKLGKVK